jgi:hypothetical protein
MNGEHPCWNALFLFVVPFVPFIGYKKLASIPLGINEI